MSDEETTEEEAPEVPYEAPAIVPELDGEGGTVFKLGEEEFASLAEAEEAQAALESEE